MANEQVTEKPVKPVKEKNSIAARQARYGATAILDRKSVV